MEFAHRIEEIITPSVEAMGFRLVSINYMAGKNPRLQIMAEHAETGRMNVEDCEKVSRTISAILDVEDPLVGAYALEISSPGIDRPLVSLEDFEKFLGFDAKIEIDKLNKVLSKLELKKALKLYENCMNKNYENC